MKEFWDKVQATRVKRGLSLQEVADKLGISKQAYFRMEGNTLKKVTDEMIINVARVLDVEVEELMEVDKKVLERYPSELKVFLATDEALAAVSNAYTEYIKNKIGRA